jgi:hypothetical protein
MHLAAMRKSLGGDPYDTTPVKGFFNGLLGKVGNVGMLNSSEIRGMHPPWHQNDCIATGVVGT